MEVWFFYEQIGLELLRQVPDLDTILVATAGGGLISGISIAAAHINPSVQGMLHIRLID